jgi:Fe-S oxidoreductase
LLLRRANKIYEAPRELIEKLDANSVEMKRSKVNGYAVEGKMFKEEPGNKEVNVMSPG